jgi:cathepsin D
VSSTSKFLNSSAPFAITYADGSTTSGPLFSDTVHVGSFDASNQTLSPVMTMSDSFSLSNFAADGILGLGWPSLSSSSAIPFFRASPCTLWRV